MIHTKEKNKARNRNIHIYSGIPEYLLILNACEAVVLQGGLDAMVVLKSTLPALGRGPLSMSLFRDVTLVA